MAPTAKNAPTKATAKKKAAPAKAPAKAVVAPVAAPPPPDPSPQPSVTSTVPRRRVGVVPIVATVLAILAGILLLRLGSEERGGPPHTGVYMGKGVPGTLYLPGKV